MRRGPPPSAAPTETGLSDAIGVPEAACIYEDCLADFETIRDDFASLDEWGPVQSLCHRTRSYPRAPWRGGPQCEAAHNESNKVRGCVSQVWLEREA